MRTIREETSRVGRARAASREVLASFDALSDESSATLIARLERLRSALLARIVGADLTSFRSSTLRSLTLEVDRLIIDAGGDLAAEADGVFRSAARLGIANVDESIAGAQLAPLSSVGLDSALISAAFDNTVDLLSLPMQQFATSIKVAVRGIALAGDSRMDAITKLRDAIAGDGFDAAQYRAERVVRTEVSRVFNGATHRRLTSASGDYPFLRKSWRSTNDSRTRLGHREAGDTYGPGSGIPIDQAFEINVYQENHRRGTATLLGRVNLMFPSDPQASPAGKLAAGATIQCRCNQMVDYDASDLATHAASRVQFALSA